MEDITSMLTPGALIEIAPGKTNNRFVALLQLQTNNNNKTWLIRYGAIGTYSVILMYVNSGIFNREKTLYFLYGSKNIFVTGNSLNMIFHDDDAYIEINLLS